MVRLARLVALVLCLAAGHAHADFAGRVVGVLDGDTVDVLVDRTPIRTRLAEIDAPEKAQAFGTRSRQALAATVFQKSVFVRSASVDSYGRAIGTLLVNGRSVNRMMVEQGMAWVYRAYLVDRSLLDVEAAARAGRVGLWVDPHAVAPWEWRAEKRKGWDATICVQTGQNCSAGSDLFAAIPRAQKSLLVSQMRCTIP